jgi:mono/diheme cytochrome c family protein
MGSGRWPACAAGVLFVAAGAAFAGDPSAAERGRRALLERPFNPPVWTLSAYERVWRHWPATPERPEPYAAAVRQRYGLHLAPYPNGDYPMGLRLARGLLGTGLTTDCMLCHAGSVAGQSYVGLGNASLDMQALYEELARADGQFWKPPFTFTNVRGTSEAGAMAVYLFALREPDLAWRSTPLDLGLRDDLCEDPPAWWLLKKKKTMYWTGSSDARSVRSLMQFMLSPFNPAAAIRAEEPTFRDIQAFLLSMEPPKYPFPVDAALARKGEHLFRAQCSQCHGTYGPGGHYPNKIVPIDVIGTDRKRYEGFTEAAGRHYNRSWFAHEKPGWLADDYPARATAGYQAPPLDGIWATAPYFHNGSAPTVYHVLKSGARPRYFTRSYRAEIEDYDAVRLGWKVEELDSGADPGQPAFERRKVYDTTLPGRGNGGHTFGDALSEGERMAVIEYLKTL